MSDPFDLVAGNDLEALRKALEREPGIARFRNDSGASLLAWAAYHGNVGAVAAVRAALPELDPHEAIIVGDGARLEEALADGWDGNTRSQDGFTPLALAAFFGNEEAFALLLPLARDVNAAAHNGQQVAALHAATAKRRAGMVERLLRAGADPDQPQADGFTPLHAAAQQGDTTIAALLLLAGADPGLTNAKGETAGAIARAHGHDWLATRLEAPG